MNNKKIIKSFLIFLISGSMLAKALNLNNKQEIINLNTKNTVSELVNKTNNQKENVVSDASVIIKEIKYSNSAFHKLEFEYTTHYMFSVNYNYIKRMNNNSDSIINNRINQIYKQVYNEIYNQLRKKLTKKFNIDKNKVKEIIDSIEKNKGINLNFNVYVELTGFSSPEGNKEKNLELAKKRAEYEANKLKQIIEKNFGNNINIKINNKILYRDDGVKEAVELINKYFGKKYVDYNKIRKANEKEVQKFTELIRKIHKENIRVWENIINKMKRYVNAKVKVDFFGKIVLTKVMLEEIPIIKDNNKMFSDFVSKKYPHKNKFNHYDKIIYNKIKKKIPRGEYKRDRSQITIK